MCRADAKHPWQLQRQRAMNRDELAERLCCGRVRWRSSSANDVAGDGPRRDADAVRFCELATDGNGDKLYKKLEHACCLVRVQPRTKLAMSNCMAKPITVLIEYLGSAVSCLGSECKGLFQFHYAGCNAVASISPISTCPASSNCLWSTSAMPPVFHLVQHQ